MSFLYPKSKKTEVTIWWSCWSTVGWCGTQRFKILIKSIHISNIVGWSLFWLILVSVNCSMVLVRLFLWIDQKTFFKRLKNVHIWTWQLLFPFLTFRNHRRYVLLLSDPPHKLDEYCSCRTALVDNVQQCVTCALWFAMLHVSDDFNYAVLSETPSIYMLGICRNYWPTTPVFTTSCATSIKRNIFISNWIEILIIPNAFQPLWPRGMRHR